jgi:hypothetical protein
MPVRALDCASSGEFLVQTLGFSSIINTIFDDAIYKAEFLVQTWPALLVLTWFM